MTGKSKTTPWTGRDSQIAEALAPFEFKPSSDQFAKIREYVLLLLKWNKFTSLTAVTDPLEIVTRHFGESIFLMSELPVENCRLADVGSGAGFPGLALKIASPALEITLIESNKKKAAFLSEVARTLELSGVEVLPMRYEELRPEVPFFNLITARAVGGFSDFLRWSIPNLSPRGHIALWLGGEDLTKVSNSSGWIWSPAAHIPESQRRFILVGRPTR